MKQAILITAYKDLDFIEEIIDYFDSDFDFFIHIDKKCKEDQCMLSKHPNVCVFSSFKIEWGSVNHLKSILLLLKNAHQKDRYSYYHLITGSDYPIQSLEQFKHFFFEGKNKNYIEYHQLPYQYWVGGGGLNRINYYWIGNSLFDIRSSNPKILNFLLKVQRKLGFRRPFPYFNGKLWGGGTYWSLSHEAIELILNYLQQNKGYIRRFNHTHCSEEIFFHTILANSSLDLVNNSLRFIDWGEGLASPKTLSDDDFQRISESDGFFARKMDKRLSEKLIARLKKFR